VSAEELAEVSESEVEPSNAGGLDGADVVPSNTGAVAKPQPAAPEEKWDLKAFKLLDTVRGTQAECITADDKLVYTGSGDGSISIWDPVELKHTTNIKAHSKAVKSILLRENTLFSAGADAVIKEWDLPTQKVVNEVKDKGEVNAIFLSDNLLFSGSNDKTVKIYDTRSCKCTATLASHTRAVKCLYVLGNYLFSGSNDQQVLVWSLQTNSVLTNLQGHEGWIKSLVGIGSTLFSGSHDETIRVWDLNTLQCQHTLKTKDKVEALLATPQALFSASGDYLEIWDSSTYTLASSTNARTSVLCLARHGPRVFCGSIGNHLKVWSCEPQPE
jgi:WD40 repeat protein